MIYALFFHEFQNFDASYLIISVDIFRHNTWEPKENILDKRLLQAFLSRL